MCYNYNISPDSDVRRPGTLISEFCFPICVPDNRKTVYSYRLSFCCNEPQPCNVTTESPTNLTKELGINDWEASEGLEEPSLTILRSAKPSRSNCSPISNSSRFELKIIYSVLYQTQLLLSSLFKS